MTCQRAPAQSLLRLALAGDVRVDVKEVDCGKPNAISVIVRGGDNSTGNDFADKKSRKIKGSLKKDDDANDTGFCPAFLLQLCWSCASCWKTALLSCT